MSGRQAGKRRTEAVRRERWREAWQRQGDRLQLGTIKSAHTCSNNIPQLVQRCLEAGRRARYIHGAKNAGRQKNAQAVAGAAAGREARQGQGGRLE